MSGMFGSRGHQEEDDDMATAKPPRRRSLPQGVLAALKQGLAAAEHAAFVAKLEKQASKK
jgi:hypothetical protein